MLKKHYAWADKIGIKRTAFTALFVLSFSSAMCCLSRRGILFSILGVTLGGMGFPIGTVGLSVLAGEFTQSRDSSMLLRDMQMAFSLGGALFSASPGIVFDRTGSYSPAFLSCSILAAFAILTLYRCYNHLKYQMKQKKIAQV